MKFKKGLLLFLALLFPACIFVFLKFFGKNEFNVAPLYSDVYPEGASACSVTVTLPYHIPETERVKLLSEEDSFTLIHFGELTTASEQQLKRVTNEHGKEIKLQFLPSSASRLKKCVFFLKDEYDLVLVDHEGVIRGEYILDDREEVDRLLTELSILLKKY